MLRDFIKAKQGIINFFLEYKSKSAFPEISSDIFRGFMRSFKTVQRYY